MSLHNFNQCKSLLKSLLFSAHIWVEYDSKVIKARVPNYTISRSKGRWAIVSLSTGSGVDRRGEGPTDGPAGPYLL